MIQISFPRAMDSNEWDVRYGGFENGKGGLLDKIAQSAGLC